MSNIINNKTIEELYSELKNGIRNGDNSLYDMNRAGLTDDNMKKIINKRKDFLSNHRLDFDTAEIIYDEVRKWKIEVEFFKELGVVTPNTQREIEALRKKDDEDTWKNTNKESEYELNKYLFYFTNGIHKEDVSECLTAIEGKRQKEVKNAEQKGKIIEKLRENPNSYDPGQVEDIIDDLKGESVIPESILNKVKNAVKIKGQEAQKGEDIFGEVVKKIPEGYTEVYFWGLPGSGKTSALSAILRTAEKRNMLKVVAPEKKTEKKETEEEKKHGANYVQYINFLKGRGEKGVLPDLTKSDITRCMPVHLKKDNKDYPISLIELSGELFQSFLLVMEGRESEISGTQQEAGLNLLMDYVRDTRNPKVHFFFIPYDQTELGDGKFANNSIQDVYTWAGQWFEQHGVFDKTLAIYIYLTKADMLLDDEEKSKMDIPEHRDEVYDLMKKKIVKYLDPDREDNVYGNFLTSLGEVAKKIDICKDGKLPMEPFSIGNVYLKYLYDLYPTSAEKFLSILLDKIEIPQDRKKTVWDKIKIWGNNH